MVVSPSSTAVHSWLLKSRTMVTTLVLKLVNIDRPWLELQLFEKLFRKTIIDEVSVELPLNPSVTNLTESFDSVLDISK